ncbi:MAG: lipopolysaccharide biosynthesis protein [Solirubrobacterales bacterium]
MASTVVTAGLGVLFWAVAARAFTTEQVGRDGALITAMISLAILCDLSINNIILRYFPQLNQYLVKRVAQAYAIVSTSALLGGVLFVIVAPLASHQFDFLRGGSVMTFAFPISVALWAIFVLQDSVLTAMSKATWLPAENGAFSAAKIVVILVMAWASVEHGVFFGWMAPLIVVVPLINFLIFTRVLPQAQERQAGASGVIAVLGWRKLLTFVTQDVTQIAVSQICIIALPLMVVALAGPTEAAYFVVPFTLITAFDLLFFAVAISIVTEGARDRERVPEMTKMAVRRIFTFVIPAALAIVAAAPLLLLPNGMPYVHNSSSVLRLLALASIFRAVVTLYVAILRLENRGHALVWIQVGNATLTLSLVGYLTGDHGATGAAWAWLIGIIATTIAILPPFVRFARNPVLKAEGLIDPLDEIEELTMQSPI